MTLGIFKRKNNVKLQVRKRRFKNLLRNTLILCAAVMLVAGLRYLSLHLEKLKINSILIEGAGETLSPGQVLAQSGLSIGLPIFTIDLPEVVRRLEENPWIQSVKVKRQLPHTLLISLKRYEPKLILNVGKLYYLNDQGKIFKEIDPQIDSLDFPMLSGLSREQVEQDPPRAREIFSDAVKLLLAFEGHPAYGQLGISEIHFDPSGGFSLYPEKQSFRVLVGFDDFEKKLKRLDLAYQKLKKMGQSFALIDLNYEGKVILLKGS
ncbi:MAG: FtsQ-type POTRA domain-containing protein [Deltaproteobacteria bacterium]|nr:FtsQ-type POTRA domain-containing protein [Deltaproteobacteria bacterium]